MKKWIIWICVFYFCVLGCSGEADKTGYHSENKGNLQKETLQNDKWLKSRIETPEQLYEYRAKFGEYLKSKCKMKEPERLQLFKKIFNIITKGQNIVKFSSNINTFVWELANNGEYSMIENIENYLTRKQEKRIVWIKLGYWVSRKLHLDSDGSKIKEAKKVLKKWAKKYPNELDLILFQSKGFEKIEELVRNKKMDQRKRIQGVYILAKSNYANTLNVFKELENEKTRLYIEIWSDEKDDFFRTFGDFVKSQTGFQQKQKSFRYPVEHYK